MNKLPDKFCPVCGHHLYDVRIPAMLYCVECQVNCDADNAATLEQVAPLRAGYDADARLVLDSGNDLL